MDSDSQICLAVLKFTTTAALAFGAFFLAFAWMERDPDRVIIAFRPPLGSGVERGERVGAIASGSQVDVYLGSEQQLLMRRGQRVTGGTTPLARQRYQQPQTSASR